MFELGPCENFSDWRDKARGLLAGKVHFDQVSWASSGFSFGGEFETPAPSNDLRIPKEFLKDAQVVAAFRDDSTWDLLYRISFRLLYEDRKLLENPLDSDTQEFQRRGKLVSRDMHKMKAFVRFREIEVGEETHYLAWYRPDHKILRLVAPFFKDRFNGMNFTIMTEDETVTWDKKSLTFSSGVLRNTLPPDEAEDLWKTYYASVFNPARVKETMMKKEMPVRYWSTMPETELVSGLMREAPERLERFYDSQRENIRTTFPSLAELSESLKNCRACGICPAATAPVPGEGPSPAKIMIVGEQPGDEEDKVGRPFRGPSGELFDEVLRRSGFRREDLYVTNAVKGFKHVIVGSFRKHRTALSPEISTCKPWLKEEMRLVQPELVICLGRTAAQAVLGKLVKLEDVRGKVFEIGEGRRAVVLPHPASILRAPEEEKSGLVERYVEDFLRLRAG